MTDGERLERAESRMKNREPITMEDFDVLADSIRDRFMRGDISKVAAYIHLVNLRQYGDIALLA